MGHHCVYAFWYPLRLALLKEQNLSLRRNFRSQVAVDQVPFFHFPQTYGFKYLHIDL
jgi:hypothetical protein